MNRASVAVLGFVAILGIAGCNGAEPPERRPSRAFATDRPAAAPVLEAVPETSSELSKAVERGEARPAGPVTDERFRRWWKQADLRVQIESQKGHIRYLQELLKLADESEQEFLGRMGLEPLYTGDAAATQLHAFQLVRRRVEQELRRVEGRLGELETELKACEPTRREEPGRTAGPRRSEPRTSSPEARP